MLILYWEVSQCTCNMKLTRIASGSVQGFGKNKFSQIFPGKYFWASSYSNNSDQWWNLNSWWRDDSHTLLASRPPTADTDAVILGSVVPYADLDRPGWIQPKSIDAGTTGITFYSALSNTITCNVSAVSPGVVTFTNNSTFNY